MFHSKGSLNIDACRSVYGVLDYEGVVFPFSEMIPEDGRSSVPNLMQCPEIFLTLQCD